MRRSSLLFPLLLAAMSPASAQLATSALPQGAGVSATSIAAAIGEWRALRQGTGFSFAQYAHFLVGNPGWPGESAMRRNAENAMRPGESTANILAFFSGQRPMTGNGSAQLAVALASSGRTAEAQSEAKNAWAMSDLGPEHEQLVYLRFGGGFGRADHDRRVDALLFARKPEEARRFLAMTTDARRGAFSARISMQTSGSDAEAAFQQVAPTVSTDAGLLMDRLRYLRAAGDEQAARQLAARPHDFAIRPEDPERFYEMLLALADGAAANRQFVTAYNIARQVDDAFAPNTDIGLKPLGIRDDYTSLTWLAGTMALDRIGRPADAIVMFDRYSRGGRSLQVQSKGLYWAGRAALSAGRPTVASTYFYRASAYPELFYGQLALERLGRPIPRPGPVPSFAVTNVQRSEFMNRRLVQASRSMLAYGTFAERELFNRALGESLKNDADRTLAVEMAQQMGRQNLAVWVARTARINGAAFYVEPAFPRVGGNFGELWSLSHGVTRQESSFDRAALSHAGARGMMQLMVPTAREQAGKMGLPFDSARLVNDSAYNMQIGSAYFRWLLNYWGGSVPLAVASYNAGIGNVGKWVRAYGDPRSGVDVLKWIEAIPFTETKGYVQRVIENSVVYDSISPTPATQSAMHVSRYLGKNRPG